MAKTVDEIVFKDATTKLAEYGDYAALKKARGMTPAEVTDELITSELRGRGGAFFPTGRKWSFVPPKEKIPKPHYLVVNADESEPGSFKDNEILSRVPHRFIEGCLITAHAIDCDKVFVYIRGEYSGPYEIQPTSGDGEKFGVAASCASERRGSAIMAKAVATARFSPPLASIAFSFVKNPACPPLASARCPGGKD